MFSDINADYNLFLNAINREVRSNQTRIEQIADKDIVATVEQERVLNDFITALVPMNNTLNNILSGKHIRMYEEDRSLVEDILLSNGQIIDVCKTSIRTIVNIREAYSAILTNGLNQTIKLLTAITIIFTIPTMVASFYGMNVALPLAAHPFAFSITLGGSILLSAILFVVFAYKKWL
jgi:magnesium transporter